MFMIQKVLLAVSTNDFVLEMLLDKQTLNHYAILKVIIQIRN